MGVNLLIIAKQFYYLKKTIVILLFCIFYFIPSFPQKAQFSLATDFTVLRNFTNEQRFWTIGQTVTAHFNFTPKDGMYAWITYSGNGKFSNDLAATAKSVFATPLQVDYKNYATMRFRHISVGWKRYLKGAYNIETSWSLYGYAGFGLLLGNIINTHTVVIDTANYYTPVLNGNADFKRLTFDIGIGYEKPIGGDVFFYMEARVLIPTTEYPSPYLFVNNNAPLISSANIGLRLLFD